MIFPNAAAILNSLSSPTRIAIVGGGFSGTMLALNLMQQPGVEVLLIERDQPRLGGGVAYSTSDDTHLLNVRAANMSAYPDQPGHFNDWLAAHGMAGGAVFVTRATYGRYLRENLTAAVTKFGRRLSLVHDEVIDVEERHDGVTISLGCGDVIEADRVVLAVGNLPPHDPPGVDGPSLPPALYTGDPWTGLCEEGLAADSEVLVIGTGLTAIDVILRLAACGFAGPITALSRRGLRPHRHDPALPHPAKQLAKPAATLPGLVDWARQDARRRDWRQVVDSIRPITQMMWSGAIADERARFLRHLRPFWDIHRHRLAPAVADQIDALVERGQLRFVAGKVTSIDTVGTHLQVAWRPRGAHAAQRLQVARAINCTGPQGDLLRASDPLLRRLLVTGRIRADRHRLGLDIDRDCHVVAADGRASLRLLAIGPMTRGDLWEVVAVPDIRIQVGALARKLANAHWIGGEGL